jgi:hypothetical protein
MHTFEYMFCVKGCVGVESCDVVANNFVLYCEYSYFKIQC